MKDLERLRWRCRRGMLELDIVLQDFLEKNYMRLSRSEIQQFDALLNLPDNDLWDIIMARKEVEDIKLQPVIQLLQTN